MNTIAYLGLGSNLGDREKQILAAVSAIGNIPGVQLHRTSAFFETEPVGGPDKQPLYLNAVAELETSRTARQLLSECQRIEKEMGRVRGEKDGPRTMDLDLLMFGKESINDPDLILPHPRLHQRLFVLDPMVELAPELLHPVLNKTMAELRFALAGTRPFGSRPGKPLHGLRVLVTGSTSGIGMAIAQTCGWAGAKVLVHGRQSRRSGEEVVHRIRSSGADCELVMCDLSRQEELPSFAERVWGVWDGLDVLVNNAGMDTLTGESASWPFEKKLEHLFAVDLRATMILSRNIGARMKSRQKGLILNVGWDQAETGMEGDSGELFSAIKGAVMAFSRSLALSLAPHVQVHCLAPGWIKTKWGHGASDYWQERVIEETPLGRWGLPEDVAAVVQFLSSPAAAFLTGQTWRINGGAVR